MAKCKNRVGEKKIANNGLEMEIVAYRNVNDIDVLFSNGVLVEHRAYQNFKVGNIGIRVTQFRRENRIGEKSTTPAGLEMELIEYRNSMDVDVRFSDGRVKHHATYWCFKHGKVSPNIREPKIGEKSIASNGLEMEIIAYRGITDIDIQFSDGTIVEHKRYCNFKAGNIKYPKIEKIGKTQIATNGMRMTLIKYRNSHDVDVQFEDGSISRHKTYQAFCNGHIKPNKEDIKYQKLLSFTKGKTEVWSELQEKVSSGKFSEVPEELNQYILKECAKSKIELEELVKKSK